MKVQVPPGPVDLHHGPPPAPGPPADPPVHHPPVHHPPEHHPVHHPPVHHPGPTPPPPVAQPPPAYSQQSVTAATPWRSVQLAAYAQMAADVLAALVTYQQETTDAAQIMSVSRNLADRVRLDLEDEAWAAWQAKMSTAFDESGQLLTLDLPHRQRALGPGYKAMTAAVSEAWAEWHRFMDLAKVTAESVLNPAVKAYAARMEQAYRVMAAAVESAKDNWSRQHNGATQAANLLGSPSPPGADPGSG